MNLPQDASIADVKKSYRNLVKEFHPDLNPSPDAREKFIAIHEAYEYLVDDDRRHFYSKGLGRSVISEFELKKREMIYKAWVERQERIAKVRAANFAERPFEELKKSRIYKTAQAVSKGYNYLFIGLCVLIIVLPLINVATGKETQPDPQHPAWLVVFPVFIGLLFAGFGYYYLFVLRTDE